MTSSWRQFFFEKGDLLFLKLGCTPLCEAIEEVTSIQWNSSIEISHVGVVARENPVRILEAREKVQEVSLQEFFRDGNGEPVSEENWFLGKVPLSEEGLSAWIESMMERLDQAYSIAFQMSPDQTYCADFIASTLNEVLEEAVEYRPMYFGELKTKARIFWESYFKVLDQELPEGKPGVSPQSIWNSPILQKQGQGGSGPIL